MKKPSIYSAKYTSARKWIRLRRTLILTLALLFLFLLFFIPYLDSKVKQFQANGGRFPQDALPVASATRPAATAPSLTLPAAQTTKPAVTSARTAASTVPVTKPAAPERLTLTVEFSGTRTAQISYEKGTDGLVRFLGAQSADPRLAYDIAPDGRRILVTDKRSQNLLIIGQELKAADHSFNSFDYAGRGKVKRSTYTKKAGFVWLRNPRFLTGDIILFESQVSLAMKPVHIWAYNIKEERFGLLEKTRSKDARIKELAGEGRIVELDGKKRLITPALEVRR